MTTRHHGNPWQWVHDPNRRSSSTENAGLCQCDEERICYFVEGADNLLVLRKALELVDDAASDYITQTLSGKPYSLSSTVYAVTAGGLVGAAVGWVPGAPGVLGPALNQTLVQTLVGGPTAMALSVLGSMVPSP